VPRTPTALHRAARPSSFTTTCALPRRVGRPAQRHHLRGHLRAQGRYGHQRRLAAVRGRWNCGGLCEPSRKRLQVNRSTGHTHTHRQRTTPPTPTHTHDKNNTPNPQTNTSHKHLTTLDSGATTVRATSHARVGYNEDISAHTGKVQRLQVIMIG